MVVVEEEHWVVIESTKYNIIRRELVAHQSGFLTVQGNIAEWPLLIG